MSNLYDILGVNKNATQKEIKQKYKKLALEKHPDKVTPDQKDKVDQEFKDITNAYSILSDPEKKKKYDIECMAQNFTPEDIFKRFGFGNFFNSRFTQTEKTHVPEKIINISISYEEMWNGCIKEIDINRNIFCEKCEGKGYETKDTCNSCKGVGRIKNIQKNGFQVTITQKDCDDCKGLGYIILKTCDECKGEKHKPTTDKIKLSFKPGVNNGDKIYLEGRGDQFTKDRFQNVIVLVKLLEHPIFKRNGNDLIITYIMDFTETLFGTTKNIPHLNGETVEFKTDEIIEPGKVYNMKDLGINGGNLNIIFKVEYGITKNNLVEYLSNIINKDKIQLLNNTIENITKSKEEEHNKISLEIKTLENKRQALSDKLKDSNNIIYELRNKETELVKQVIEIGKNKDRYINQLEQELNNEKNKKPVIEVEKNVVMSDESIKLNDEIEKLVQTIKNKDVENDLLMKQLEDFKQIRMDKDVEKDNIISKLQEKLDRYVSITEKLKNKLKSKEDENKDVGNQKKELNEYIEYINKLKRLIHSNGEENEKLKSQCYTTSQLRDKYIKENEILLDNIKSQEIIISELKETLKSYQPKYTEIPIKLSIEGIYNGCYKSIYFGNDLKKVEFPSGCMEKTIGNTIFKVIPLEHSIYKLEGDNIRMRFDGITFKQSLHGISQSFKYLNGEDIAFNTKEVLDPSKDYKIPGLGINGGDLIINFGINYPEFSKQQLMKIKCII